MWTCKKFRVLGLAIVLALFCLAAVSAYGLEEGQGLMAADKNEKIPADKKHDCAMAMKMKCMMHKQIVATSDGGIVVLSGSTLIKYDKSLNLVKEVELKANVCLTKEMIKDAKGGCYMHDKAKDKDN